MLDLPLNQRYWLWKCGSLLCSEWQITFPLEVCSDINNHIFIINCICLFNSYMVWWCRNDVVMAIWMTALTFASCSTVEILPILWAEIGHVRTCIWIFSCFAFVHLQALHLVHSNGDAMKLKTKTDRQGCLTAGEFWHFTQIGYSLNALLFKMGILFCLTSEVLTLVSNNYAPMS